MDDGRGAVVQEADGAGEVHDPAERQLYRRPAPGAVESILERAAFHELAQDDEGLVPNSACPEEQHKVGVSKVGNYGNLIDHIMICYGVS